MDRTSPPDREVPVGRPGVAWGIGDFFWIYFGGLVAGLVLGSIGFAISGDAAGQPGAFSTGMAFLGQFGGWIVGLVWVSRSKGRGTLRSDFGLVVHARDWWVVVAGVGLELGLAALVLPLVNLVHNQHQDVVQDLEKAHGLKLALIALVAGLVAPLCEELLFRGLLLRALCRRLDAAPAVAVAALVFALAHPMLDPTLGTLAVVPALFALGAVSGVAALRRGDLSASILVHVGFNLLTTAYALRK